jgi:hypothetical protein
MASLGILLVLALAVLASSPDLHERLHSHPAAAHQLPAPGHGANAGDDGCVVTLFAQGIVAALMFFLVVFSGDVVRPDVLPAPAMIPPGAPPYLRLPTQAPPRT